MKAAVIGLWHQGVVGAACLAKLGFDVVGGDLDGGRIEALRHGRAPLFEPGLDDLLADGIAQGRLSFTSDIASAVSARPLIFWMFDTTVNDADESDLSELFVAARSIAPAIAPGALLLSSAQAPVGTTSQLEAAMREVNPGLQCAMAYTPENLRLGEAIDRFYHPALPIIGSDDATALASLTETLRVLSAKWYTVSLRTAEMVKHALNGYLALSVTFANEFGNICDEIGADGKAVGQLLRLDPRIGPKAMLAPGLGFAGGTLARDVQTLRGLGDRFGIKTPLLDGLWDSNLSQNRIVKGRLKSELGDLAGKTIAILGLTYKPGTSTLRRSAAIEIANELIGEGARVFGHDPKAIASEIAAVSRLRVASDPYEAVEGCDAVVLMTPWRNYESLDFAKLRAKMRRPFIFDTAGMWDHESLTSEGFIHWDIGRGRLRKPRTNESRS